MIWAETKWFRPKSRVGSVAPNSGEDEHPIRCVLRSAGTVLRRTEKERQRTIFLRIEHNLGCRLTQIAGGLGPQTVAEMKCCEVTQKLERETRIFDYWSKMPVEIF